MSTLTAGANIRLVAAENEFSFAFVVTSGTLDIVAFLLNDAGQVRGDADMIFYGQRFSAEGALSLQIAANRAIFHVDCAKIPADVQRIAFCAALDGAENLSVLQNLTFALQSGTETIAEAQELAGERPEAALILAEMYRYQGQWKCRWVMQGFRQGLAALATHYGVEIAEDAPSSAEPNTPSDTATPSEPASPSDSVVMNRTNDFLRFPSPAGLLKVHLSWQNPATGGLWRQLLGRGLIDLDLGALVRLRDGSSHLVQALGHHNGSRHDVPFVELQGDERTNEAGAGEWLFVNTAHWAEIKQVVVFCFVYRGQEWPQAALTIHLPAGGVVNIPLEEVDNDLGLCGMVALRNFRGQLELERVMRYFPDQCALDQYYGFGLDWQAQRK